MANVRTVIDEGNAPLLLSKEPTSNAETYVKPRWLRDLLRFVPLKSQFVLSGNVRDLQTHQVTPELVTVMPLTAVLASELESVGFTQVLAYDLVAGFSVLSGVARSSEHEAILQSFGVAPMNGASPIGADTLGVSLERIVRSNGPATAVVINFASRLISRADSLSVPEHQLFTRALVLSQTAQARPMGKDRAPLFNVLIWIVDKEGDLPDWLIVANPRLRHIPISLPDRTIRRAIAPALLRTLPGGQQASPDAVKRAEDDLVDETEGLLLMDLSAIAQLGRSEGLQIARVSDAVRRYKIGVTDDPWMKIERAKIRGGADFVRQRVIGQDQAVTHMLDLIKRAVTGVTGAHRGGRPRGLAFLAGPTGVGKTELAKSITALLFGDEGAYIRFDMSEFSAEHADQRLIGAPPGYVGYDVGGELTNAIREKPFSVVLFDEIEKAHPRILDKFLQVLDEGVLTSGRGDRVYFSEALIIFTSNLGIYTTDAAGERIPNVTPDSPFDEVQRKVRGEIESYFKLVLNRPEILNRIGENIIVFDFIRHDVAILIFNQMVDGLLSRMKESGYEVTLLPEVKAQLQSICLADLSNGGRGVRNQLEAHFINPLSRALFEQDALGGQFCVEGLEKGVTTTLRLAHHP